MKEWLKDISEEEHSLLLYRLNSLPGDERLRELEGELKDGLAQYHKLLGDLENTVRGYIETARKIKGIDPGA